MIDINDAWYRVSVKAIIKNQEWKILLCYEEKKWVWDLPWGWLDHWEKPEEALIREIKEEMWLSIISMIKQPVCFITANKSLSETRPWIWNLCYEVIVENLDFIPSDECSAIWFYDLEDIKNIQIFENVEKVFQELF